MTSALRAFHWLCVVLCLSSCAGGEDGSTRDNMASETSIPFDWQGHRGARGLAPENTVPAFLRALEYPVTTLELDLAVSADSQLIVSHEPWMSATICSRPDGRPVPEAEAETFALFGMTLSEIRSFDCGSRGHPDFPEQEPMPAHKPTLEEVVLAVRQYCADTGRERPRYNLEIKSQPEWDGRLTPEPQRFASLVVEELARLGLREISCVQSFDFRSLEAVHALDSTLTTAMLVANQKGLQGNLTELGYQPEIYSPYFRLVSAGLVDSAHARGMRIIPWTVNEVEQMQTLRRMGVDGIITDYPDRVLQLK